MKRVLLIMIWIFTATLAASAQTSFFYPHIVNGVLGNITWKTTIFLTNPASSGTATGAVTFTQDNSDPTSSGSSWPITLTDETGFTTTSSTFTFSLPPGATRKLVSSSPGSFLSGFANVTTNPGTVSGTAIFSEFDSAGSLIGEAGVPSVNAVPRQAIFADTLAKYSVGMAFANPSPGVANITLTLLDSSGVAVSTPVTKMLGSGNHTQAFTFQLFPSAQPLIGTVQITSNLALVAIALRFDPTLSKFTTLPPVTLASLIGPASEWLQERPWLTPLTAIARLLGSLQLRIG